MANKQLFSSKKKDKTSGAKALARNRAGGKAYSRTAKGALASYAATGMLGNTFYTTAKDHLDKVLELAQQVPVEYLAKVAVYSRRQAHLKDMPALLLAVLATRDVELFKKVFPLVIDNGRMVRNFVQIMRSGAVGRSSLGSAPKKMVQRWLQNQDDDYIFKSSVGNDPSLADVIRLVHPRPQTKTREALYRYIVGMPMKGYKTKLTKLVKDYEKFKTSHKSQMKTPDLPFEMLTSINLGEDEWREIAKNGKWQFTRMNLNTFARHGVFKDDAMVKMIADRLKDESLVRKSRNYPYQLWMSYKATVENTEIPAKISNALQTALDHSLKNVPDYGTTVHVLVDISGSMSSPVGGRWPSRGGSNEMCYVDIGALFGSAVIVKNEDSQLIAFNDSATKVDLNPRDSLVTNAKKVRDLLGGGTNCGAPMQLLNKQGAKGDLVVMISDNESWMSIAGRQRWGGTDMQAEWKKYKARNPEAVLVCIDAAPSTTSQAVGEDVLFVGGFNDKVFDVIKSFLESRGDHTHWEKMIDKVSISVN